MTAADFSALNFWSVLYTVGAWLVVVGVVMEGAEIAARWEHNRRLKKFSELMPETPVPEKHWVHNLGDSGFIILVGALVLEQVCHQKIESINERTQHALVAELTTATTLAGQANDRAATNELAAKRLESANLILRSNVVALELELENSKSLFTPRGEQWAVSMLRMGVMSGLGFKPAWVRIVANGFGVQSGRLAGQLESIFKKAGYDDVKSYTENSERPQLAPQTIFVTLYDKNNLTPEEYIALQWRFSSLTDLASAVKGWNWQIDINTNKDNDVIKTVFGHRVIVTNLPQTRIEFLINQ